LEGRRYDAVMMMIGVLVFGMGLHGEAFMEVKFIRKSRTKELIKMTTKLCYTISITME
jgi:hypothetical protein